MQIYRARINQPSTLQPLHRLNGVMAIVADSGGDTVRLHFTAGDVHEMDAPRLSISIQYNCEAHRQAHLRVGSAAFPTYVNPALQVYRATVDRAGTPILQGDLHGRAVIVADDGEDQVTVYLTEGDVHSVTVPRAAISRTEEVGAKQALPDVPATKRIEVRLSALTRVEYTEVVDVPADLSDGEIAELVEKRYQIVGANEFVADPDYWERGTCYATAAAPGEQASVAASRAPGGGFLFDEFPGRDDDIHGLPVERG